MFVSAVCVLFLIKLRWPEDEEILWLYRLSFQIIQALGCDKVLGSSKVFDRCGVCNGDGTACIGKRFTYKGFPKPMKGGHFVTWSSRNRVELETGKNLLITMPSLLWSFSFPIPPLLNTCCTGYQGTQTYNLVSIGWCRIHIDQAWLLVIKIKLISIRDV